MIGTADVEIGSDSFIGHDVTIYGDGSVVIGSNVDIGPGTTILTGTHLVDFRGIRVAGKGESRSVAIGNGTWICANTTINPGVIVGQGCLVASGTVLYRSLPDGYVARSAAIEVAPLGKRG